jgi:calcium-dependent protein kinase
MVQILQALSYVHSLKICHRDLKLENFICESEEDFMSIKLIDFGLSKKYMDDGGSIGTMSSMVGTPYYMAPEIFSENGYDLSCDMWGVGVLAYILLSGKPPFNGKTDGAIFKKIMDGAYDFRHDCWREVSNEAKDFIAKCLRVNPAQRLSAKSASSHPWLTGLRTKVEDLDPKIFVSLKEYKTEVDFTKLSTSALAFGLNKTEMKALQEAFTAIDTDGNGSVTLQELQSGLFKNANMSEEELKEIFTSVDTDNSGKISYSEFVACTLKRQIKLTEKKLKEAFDLMDIDKSGYIDETDLQHLLATDNTGDLKGKIKEIIGHADVSNDGKINFQEFLEAMTKDSRQALDSVIIRPEDEEPELQKVVHYEKQNDVRIKEFD